MAIDANGQELNVGDKVFYITVRCGGKRPKIGVIEKICPQKVRISNGNFKLKINTGEKIPFGIYQKHSQVVKVIDSIPKQVEYKPDTQLELFS